MKAYKAKRVESMLDVIQVMEDNAGEVTEFVRQHSIASSFSFCNNGHLTIRLRSVKLEGVPIGSWVIVEGGQMSVFSASDFSNAFAVCEEAQAHD